MNRFFVWPTVKVLNSFLWIRSWKTHCCTIDSERQSVLLLSLTASPRVTVLPEPQQKLHQRVHGSVPLGLHLHVVTGTRLMRGLHTTGLNEYQLFI